MTQVTDVFARPVIVGVGEDGHSRPAIERALELSRRFDTPLEFVHGVPEHEGAASTTPLATRGAANAQRLTAASERLTHVLDELSDHAEAPPSRALRVLPGRAARVIVERAKALDAGFILLGPHERRGLLDFGSTTRGVLAHAPCPVWIQPDSPQPLHRILVPVDLSEDSRGALEFGCDLARRTGGWVRALYCFVSPDFAYPDAEDVTMPTYVVDDERAHARAEFEAFIRDHGCSETQVDMAFVDGDPASVVLDMQDAVDAVVMATHGRGGLSAAVMGSVTNAVLRQAHVPVIAVRHASRVLELPP